MTDDVELLKRVWRVRHFMPDIWRAWHVEYDRPVPVPLSTGTCGRTSLLLQKILQADGYAARWCIGSALQECGFFDGEGWRSHAWVVCSDLILDITADQFGAPPVIVSPVGDSRYRESNVDPASEVWQVKRDLAASEAMVLWRRHSEAHSLP